MDWRAAPKALPLFGLLIAGRGIGVVAGERFEKGAGAEGWFRRWQAKAARWRARPKRRWRQRRVAGWFTRRR